MPTPDWYTLHKPETVDSPALLVYADRVEQNIQTALRLARDPDRFRPHVKTHKMRAVTDRLLAAGVSTFKCATIAEADMLAQAGAADVLLAYPVVGPKAGRLRALMDAYPKTHFSCLVDDAEAARQLAETMAPDQLDVYIDLNVGMNRTGIAPHDALALYQQIRSLAGLRVVGVHAYDGHIRHTDPAERNHAADTTFALADDVRQQLEQAAGQPLTLVMGGSPTFMRHADRLTTARLQTSPGTFVFWDAGYAQLLPDFPFVVAAVLLTRVISITDDNTLTLDLGHKAVAAENPFPRVVFLNQPEAEPIGQSEEHLVVRLPNARRHQPGEVWYGVPIHICPTVALHDRVCVVADGHVVDHWTVTARGRMLTY